MTHNSIILLKALLAGKQAKIGKDVWACSENNEIGVLMNETQMISVDITLNDFIKLSNKMNASEVFDCVSFLVLNKIYDDRP